MPGVTSIRLSRPPTDTHMFYGPFDDVTRRGERRELAGSGDAVAARGHARAGEFAGEVEYEFFFLQFGIDLAGVLKVA